MPCVSNDLHIEVRGERLQLDPCGAVWWPRLRTLIFSDLHFEKGSSYARGGQFLPPYDTRATLLRMAAAVARHAPSRIVALGDSFHDPDAAERLGLEERARLAVLAQGLEWVWITGNHDPRPPAWLGGEVAEEITLGPLTLRHEPRGAEGEIAGHLHPCARVSRWGRSVRRRCFVSDGERMILPSYGAYTGGLDVEEAPIATLFRQGFHTYMLGRERVYRTAPRRV
jgi:hypothetical protein